MQTNQFENDIKVLATGTGVTLIGGVLGKGLFFLSQIIIARLLGVESFGLYSLGFALVNISAIVGRLGLNTGGMRFVSIYKDDDLHKLKGIIISSISIALLSGIIIALIIYIFSGFISFKLFNKPDLKYYITLFTASIPLVTCMTVLYALLQGSYNLKYTVLTRDIIQPTANILLVILFYYFDLGLFGVILGYFLSYAIAVIFGIVFIGKLFPVVFIKSVQPVFPIKKLLTYSLPLLFVGFLTFFLSWTDVLMLGYLGNEYDVGIYRAASQVPMIITIFLWASNAIYAPLVANFYNKNELDRIENIFKVVTKWVTFATTPFFIFMLVCSKELMYLFGKEYVTTGYPILMILSIAYFIHSITCGNMLTLTMTGKQNIELINSLSSLIITVGLNMYFIPRYGVFGAAIVSLFISLFINFLRLFEIYYFYNIIAYSRSMIIIILPIFICLLPSFILFNYYSFDHYFFIKLMLILITFTIFFKYIDKSKDDIFILNTLNSFFVTILLKFRIILCG